jgi:uncharacterized membrane-anchored protein
MTRALGVFVVLLAFVATAAADKTTSDKDKAPAKQPAKTKQESKADKKKAPAAEEQPAGEEDAADGSDAPPTPEEIEASLPPHIKGPKLVDLGHNIEFDLPAGMILLERDEARKALEKSGDDAESIIAMVYTLDSSWTLYIDYDDVGYVSDSDANELDANALVQSFQEGTTAQNAKRRTLGVPELFLDGWSEKPQYEPLKHHLVWGLKAHSTEGPAINFFTRILGRNGYMSVNLVDGPDTIEKSKTETAALLTALRYRAGSTYADHKEGDRDSGLGLKALVLGGVGLAVAKKTGILVGLILVLKKGFIFIFAGIAGFFRWITGRSKKGSDDLPPSDPPPSDPPPVG